MSSKKQVAEPWKDFLKRWQKITSPTRPTLKEIKTYEKFGLSNLKKKEADVLILGATPEIRDMLAKYKNAQVCLIDINLEAILAMTFLMKNKKAKENEVWMRANWLKAPLPKNYFDLIYGDFVICNVPFRSQDKFLKNISRWLKPNGLFISKILGFKPEYQDLSLKEFCDMFKNKPINLKTTNLFWEIGVCCLGKFKKENKFIAY